MANERTFLIELGCEELPPGAIAPLAEALAAGLCRKMDDAELPHGEVHAWGTPRRLTVAIERLADIQPDRHIEKLGPALKAAYKDGEPTKAALGFARSCGVDISELEEIDTDKGLRLGHRHVETGQSTCELMPAIAESAVNELPVPKNMRWGDSRVEFSRPVHWLVMLHGEDVIPATILGLTSDRITYGHRFHAPEAIELVNADTYLEVLETRGKVLADMNRRRQEVLRQVQDQAKALKATAVIDDDLLTEVTGLVEWPVALAGRFDERFLEVPPECLVSSMKANQKYFHLLDEQDNLIPAFITISNIESRDPRQVIEGNERVIRPRLADAAFFFETDRKRTLASRCDELSKVVFQQKLGTLADKSRRTRVVAAAIASSIGSPIEHAERAAELAKCDLVTEMVLEFPELQGIMGAYYARFDEEAEPVARALYQQYLPRFAGDETPDEPTGVALALADRLDTLTGIFGIGQRPSGTRDPFALRRASISVLSILVRGEYNLDLRELLGLATKQHSNLPNADTVVNDVLEYMLDRFRTWAQDAGMPVEVYQAVRARPVTRPYDFERRLKAVHHFSQRDEARALAAANKRVANILSKQDGEVAHEVDVALLTEPAEKALHDAIVSASDRALPLIGEGDYAQALDALAELKGPVDAFFDQVMVMAEDDQIRRNRLAILASLQQLFLEIADISLLPQG
ncbi:glycine--tRNA ligase subunit beta [Larsenimonas rhizosphaerae]|uniref:glycine--tRNA ligase subunit beta n=1 Tax=Larsenimonas rhizosphaerae TaxID=2944682 RepID=UPI0020344B40|nr:glycine--tRNA ligase subunit beta [Larsenimonas rhizosphaerae]MCM2129318.1 glycine--tRNA ligase subunit beta [Larsenimonas rhizosphaerae]